MARKYEIDMTHGSLFDKIILFAIPLALSSVLQLLFNAADVVVVGRYAGNTALAAVGSTTALNNLLINLFIGLSVGANIVISRHIGAEEYGKANVTVHTAILIAIVSGIALAFIGNVLARPLLTMMDTPDDVIELSTLYMKIIFMGMPSFVLYNFGASILRSIGDTRRPLYFLTISGVLNVILNLIFVIKLHMSVDGVAYATITSQTLSAILVIYSLVNMDNFLRLNLKGLLFNKEEFIDMAKVGLPAGLQGVVFSISNVLIQSSVNSFGSTVMAGNTAAGNIEGFVYNAMNSVHQAAMTFTSQNYGAKQYKRIDKIMWHCIIIVSVIGIGMGVGAYMNGHFLLNIYAPNDEAVISFGLIRLSLVCAPYFLCGIMDVMCGMMRGIGSIILPMVVSLTGACALRVIWIYTIFAQHHTLLSLYISYPISWLLTFIVHFICFKIYRSRLKENTL